MTDSSGATVLWILGPLFAAVGVYLIWYSHRRKRMLAAFAQVHQFRVTPESEGLVQETLDHCFSLAADNLVRSFGQVASVIEGDGVRILRSVELLDLNPHAQSNSTHFCRIAALFEVATDCDECFVVNKSGQVSERLPGSNRPDASVAAIAKRIIASCGARHTLCVTLARGHALLYFEPLITGGETLSDVESLYRIAKSMQEELAKSGQQGIEPAPTHATAIPMNRVR